MRIISPSILSADFKNISEEIIKIEEAGATRIHLDVMDGHFVPNLTFGPFIIKAIKKITNLHLETHLMISNPYKYLDKYIDSGADTLIIHAEASNNISKDLELIKNRGINCGLALNPNTHYRLLHDYLDLLDYILIMSVNPGFGGQVFIEETLQKMESINKICIKKDCRKRILLGVDGGVNLNTIDKVYKTGIDITVVGSGLFKAKNFKHRFQKLTNANIK